MTLKSFLTHSLKEYCMRLYSQIHQPQLLIQLDVWPLPHQLLQRLPHLCLKFPLISRKDTDYLEMPQVETLAEVGCTRHACHGLDTFLAQLTTI